MDTSVKEKEDWPFQANCVLTQHSHMVSNILKVDQNAGEGRRLFIPC